MSFKLPESIADRLLDLLGHDDAYRAMFLANPRLALASIGFEPAADASVDEGLWICFGVTTLAPKATFIESRKALQVQLKGDQSYQAITLGIGKSKVTGQKKNRLVEA